MIGSRISAVIVARGQDSRAHDEILRHRIVDPRPDLTETIAQMAELVTMRSASASGGPS